MNERSKGENNDQKRFRHLLLNLQNGDSTERDWNLLQSRTPDSVGRKKDTKEMLNWRSQIKKQPMIVLKLFSP